MENVSHRERNVELETIKDLEIAEEVAIFIFDDYYYLFEKAEKIQEVIKEAKLKGIKVFYGNSKEKLP